MWEACDSDEGVWKKNSLVRKLKIEDMDETQEKVLEIWFRSFVGLQTRNLLLCSERVDLNFWYCAILSCASISLESTQDKISVRYLT